MQWAITVGFSSWFVHYYEVPSWRILLLYCKCRPRVCTERHFEVGSETLLLSTDIEFNISHKFYLFLILIISIFCLKIKYLFKLWNSSISPQIDPESTPYFKSCSQINCTFISHLADYFLFHNTVLAASSCLFVVFSVSLPRLSCCTGCGLRWVKPGLVALCSPSSARLQITSWMVLKIASTTITTKETPAALFKKPKCKHSLCPRLNLSGR